MEASAILAFRLDQVPLVAVEVLEHGNRTIGLMPRRLEEDDAVPSQALVVAGEVIRFEEEADSAAGLVADTGPLFGSVRPREQQFRAPLDAHRDPALASAQRSIGQEREPKFLAIESDGLVIVTDQ